MAIDNTPMLVPHLVVDDAAAAIDFYVKAFGAEEMGRRAGPDGKLMHAALRINGSTVMLNDDFPEFNDGKSTTPTALGGTPVTIHLHGHRRRAPVPAGRRRRRHRGQSRSRTNSGATATAWCAIRSVTTGRWASRCARSAWTRSRRR